MTEIKHDMGIFGFGKEEDWKGFLAIGIIVLILITAYIVQGYQRPLEQEEVNSFLNWIYNNMILVFLLTALTGVGIWIIIAACTHSWPFKVNAAPTDKTADKTKHTVSGYKEMPTTTIWAVYQPHVDAIHGSSDAPSYPAIHAAVYTALKKSDLRSHKVYTTADRDSTHTQPPTYFKLTIYEPAQGTDLGGKNSTIEVLGSHNNGILFTKTIMERVAKEYNGLSAAQKASGGTQEISFVMGPGETDSYQHWLHLTGKDKRDVVRLHSAPNTQAPNPNPA